MIGSGLWDKREEQIENIIQAGERVAIFKDLPSIEEADQDFINDSSIIYNYYISKIFKRKKYDEKGEKHITKNKEKKEEMKESLQKQEKREKQEEKN